MNTASTEVRFQAFKPWFLLQSSLLIGLGGSCLALATGTGSRWWWSSMIVVVLAGSTLAFRHSSRSIIVRGCDLTCRYGVWRVTTRSIHLWEFQLTTHQSWLGRILDYGTVHLQVGNELVQLKSMSSIQALHYIVAQRRQELLPFLIHQPLFDVIPGEAVTESYSIKQFRYLPQNIR